MDGNGSKCMTALTERERMMSVQRQMERMKLKQQYAKFTKAWQNEKRYQQYRLTAGEELEKGHYMLGRKPTFTMWLDAVKNKQINAAGGTPPPLSEGVSDPKQVVVTDEDWE